MSGLVPMKPEVSTTKSVALMVIGLLAFVLYLYFFVGFDEIRDVLSQVDPLRYYSCYSLTIAAIVLSMLFYAMAWHDLLKSLSLHISLQKVLAYAWIANFVDLIIPLETVSGELTKTYLLQRDIKENLGKIAASIVSLRVIANLSTLIGLSIGSAFLIFSYRTDPFVLDLLTVVLAGTAASVVIMVYLSISEDAARKLVHAIIRLVCFVTRNRLNLVEHMEKAQRSLSAFHDGIKTFGRNPKFLLKPAIYIFVSWFMHLSVYFLVFYGLGFTVISISVLIIVYSVSMSVGTIPITLPVGLVEIVMTSLYVLFGIPAAVSGTATTLIRVITFWFQLLVGYVIIQWVGIKTIVR
jgi:hypothetical protein